MGRGGGPGAVVDSQQNLWKDDEKVTVLLHESGDNARYDSTARLHMINSQRLRRMIAFAIFLAAGMWVCWSMFLRHSSADAWAVRATAAVEEDGTYGVERHRVDKNLVRLKRLDENLLPGGEADPKGERRLVFVGDVHGCKKELLKLLRKVGFNEDLDHLVLVGDVISKGPDNVGVLDELIRLNATSVRGNHEDNVLLEARRLAAREKGLLYPNVDDVKAARKKAKDREVLRSLKPRHVEYLKGMPLMLHIPSLPLASGSTKRKDSPITEQILVVHAGLVPGVDLQKQDPYFVMNMRSINRHTFVPSTLRAGKNAKPWFEVWNWYNDKVFRKQSSLAAGTSRTPDTEPSTWFGDLWKNFFGKHKHSNPQVIIYGHDSHTGLQMHRWSKGLDSGCVAGGRLTMLVLNAKGEQEVVSVRCKNYRD